MNTLKVIGYIVAHPKYTNVVIDNGDNMTPRQAIDLLSSVRISYEWRLEESLEPKTLLIYTKD